MAILIRSILFSIYFSILILVGFNLLALTIEWILIRRWKSIIAIFPGGLVLFLSWYIIYYIMLVIICNNEPQNCEGFGIGLLILMQVIIVQVILTFILSVSMLVIYRIWVWKGAAPPGHLISEWRAPLLLWAGALLGLLAAIGLVLIYNSGLFNTWQRLDVPPSLAQAQVGNLPYPYPLPEKVDHPDEFYFAAFSEVVIGSPQGQYYRVSIIDPRKGKPGTVEWQIVKSQNFRVAYEDQIHLNRNECNLKLLVLPPPVSVSKRIQVYECNRNDLRQSEYALGEDGSLYVWRSNIPIYYFLWWSMVIGPFVGYLAALVLVMRKERILLSGLSAAVKDDRNN